MTDPTPNTPTRRGSATTGSRRRTSPSLVTALLTLAWLVPGGVVLQAVLAGQAWFVSPGLFGLHGGIGHGVLMLAVLTAGLAWVCELSRPAAILASVAVVGLIGQTGLGYVGHRGGVALASALHVPLGVSILGLTVAVAVLVTVRRADDAAGRRPAAVEQADRS